jgi:Rrf2 family protein
MFLRKNKLNNETHTNLKLMSKIVSISEAASIAIHAMVMIARSGKKNLNVNKLSELTGASRNHIAKVTQRLVKYNFLRSTRGPAGGFVLSVPASEISLLSIYEAVEGKMDVAECPFDNKICPFHKCLMNGIVHKLTEEIRIYFKSQKLSDLME